MEYDYETVKKVAIYCRVSTKEKFVKENPDLGILDDDYADLYLRYEFQEYCDKEYNKR